MSAPAAAGRPASPWLYGPGRDLLLGCGLGYALVFAVLCLYGSEVRATFGAGAIPFLTLLVGAPHYGATLLRVYERREDRRAYSVFAVWITLAVAAAFVAGTRSLAVGSLLLTLYITWSPWHYTGQNYGLAVLFLRRRGVRLDAVTKRWVYASFLLSYVLTFAALHRAQADAGYAPTLYAAESYRFLPLGLPAGPTDAVLAVLAAAYALALVTAGVRLLRRASRPRELLPAAMLALTQGLWFSIPVLARHWDLGQALEPLSRQHGTYYFFWAALGHSVQYVWVTSYFARSASGYAGFAPYLWKALLAGTALWTLPPLLFAPDLLGRIPFDAGLGALVASTVNLHHFILDGAIWKLRDGRIARVLIRSDSAGERPAPIEARATPWLRPAFHAAGIASLGIVLLAQYEQAVGLPDAFARGDVARIRLSSQRLDWIGRESAALELQLGRVLAARKDVRGALRAYQESAALRPTPAAWYAQADLLEGVGMLDDAVAAYERALALAPDDAALSYRAGLLSLQRGDLERARDLLGRAVELDPERRLYRLALHRAEGRRAPAREGPEPLRPDPQSTGAPAPAADRRSAP